MYELLKASHILSIILWLGTMFTTTVVLAGIATYGDKPNHIAQLQLIATRLMNPAFVIALISGLGMAQYAGWIGAPWVISKIIILLILGGIHGFIFGMLKRAAGGEALVLPRNLYTVSALIVFCLSVAIVLAVTKPG